MNALAVIWAILLLLSIFFIIVVGIIYVKIKFSKDSNSDTINRDVL